MRAALLLFSLLSSACGYELEEGARLKPLESTTAVADRGSARPLPEGAIPFDAELRSASFERGIGEGGFVTTFPMAVSSALLQRGEERFSIHCTPCHGADGEGRGPVVSRGFPVADSLKSVRLRTVPPGYVVNVITEGFGAMPSYEHIRPADRWAIAAFIMNLQGRDPWTSAVDRDQPIEGSRQ